MEPAVSPSAANCAKYAVRRVGLLQPFGWLARGARDMAAHPGPSLFYGFCMAAAGAVILLALIHFPFLFAAAISGFLLVGPLLATGLYDLSRRRERGEPVRLGDSLRAWRTNSPGLVGFGLLSLLAGTVWQILSLVIAALLYKGSATEPWHLMMEILVDPQHTLLFFVYVGVGGTLAALVFAVSVVSVPLLLDCRCGLLVAMRVSIDAIAENPLPLALWATLIMVLTGLGFATGLLGFTVIMPLLGHASWHAYRDLVGT